MNKQIFKNPLSTIKRIFKPEETRFIVLVGLKVSGISFGINLVIYYFLYQVMRLNYAFFKAHGFPEFHDENPFYEYVTQEAVDNLYILFSFHVFIFFIGVYVGWLILRPFRTIAEYSEQVMANPNTVYKVEEFSTYKLLIRFSEFFFEYLREGRKKGEITATSVPPQFSGIHRPVLDKIFMLHFGLLLIIIGISTAVFTIENSSAIYTNMAELATKTLSNSKIINKYFTEQEFILDELFPFTVFLVTLFYTMLGFHLYAKVSGAAFGIFSTMRSFMKGNHSSRVHLVGYAYIRDHTRKINKYLDYIHNNYSKDRPKG